MVHADLVQGLGSKEVAIDFYKGADRGRRHYQHEADAGAQGPGTENVRDSSRFYH